MAAFFTKLKKTFLVTTARDAAHNDTRRKKLGTHPDSSVWFRIKDFRGLVAFAALQMLAV